MYREKKWGFMKDVPYWRGLINNSKTVLDLKAVGQNLALFQNQSGLFSDEEKKLTENQVTLLREMYSDRLEKLDSEALDVKLPGRPEFNK